MRKKGETIPGWDRSEKLKKIIYISDDSIND